MVLDTYQNHGKWLAREVLHAIFFLPRNDEDIQKNVRSRPGHGPGAAADLSPAATFERMT